ncbi:AAA family ATPase [Hymenobacter cellulosilyticus]|uniref:AAA family ATPase n=1 Tax=Hymenobacter cellulosilyticus TaxID=2932248 RepID=A0A8T9QAV4_9BACT|nr:AAA family ATPase [Hymenobacter cellulosilyticus]UOQ74696.1 AAA family ATPase [Hymenobacter cellulosilyticus]
MKILRVRFFNLNSLRGQHEVDFAASPLSDAGLFAITGPTGAGKTTILDAITLALYGQVPRHDGSGPEQIMSHGTGESWAEVEFQVNDKRYRAKWGQYRSRRKADGKLQPPTMELSEYQEPENPEDAPQWPFLETYKSKVPGRVAELSGLEYRQFLRSVLLAQGEFTKFLKSSPGERAQLLEKITDTRKYSDISRAAFDKAKQETQQVEVLRAGLAGVTLLNAEEVTELESEVAEFKTQLTTVTAEQQRLQEAQLWLRRLADLTARQQHGQQRLLSLAQEAEALSPIRQRVSQHEQALPFRTPWALLQQAHTQIQRLQREAEQLQIQLPRLQEQFTEASQARQQTQRRRDEAAETQQLQEPRLREAEKLDTVIQLDEAQLLKDKQEYDQNNEQCKQLKASAEQAAGRLRELQAQIKDLSKWLEVNANVSELAELLPELSANIQDWEHLNAELGQLRQRLQELRQRQQQAATALAQHEQTTALAQKQLAELAAQQHTATADRNRWLRRLRHQVSALQKDQQTQQQHHDDLRRSLQMQQLVLSHEGTRELLVAGEPCPVCGALEHPYLAGVLGISSDSVQRDTQREEELGQRVRALGTRFNRLNTYVTMLEQTSGDAELGLDEPIQLLPETEEAGVGELVRSLVKQLQEMERQRSGIELQLAQASSQQASAAQQQQAYTQDADKLSQQLRDAEERVPTVRGVIASLLLNFGLEFTDLNGRALMKLASDRAAEFSQKQQQQHKAQQELAGISATFEKTEEERERLQIWLRTRKQELLDKHAAIQQQKQQRHELFAGSNVGAARRELTAAVEEASKQLDQATEALKNRETALSVATESLRKSEQEARRQHQEHEQQHAALVADLQTAGLAPDPAALATLLLPDTEVRRLADQLQTHEQAVATTQQNLTEAAQQFQQEQQRNLTSEPAETVSEQLQNLNEQLAQLNQQLGQRQQRLLDHHRGLERHAALAQQLEKQQQEARRWRQLAELIGSADGKKFSEFAQGLTLARLVDLANRHLHRLTDRYRITRNPEEHLDLLIIDEYQAGNSRSMNSLSGGESFLVSLALALGLSELAGRKTQINTLFIDEGFGTLDPDTLEIALSALETLQGTGKTIGIISHVEALKERVSTQINVRKGAGGVSSLRVVGFGVEKE